MLRPFHRLLTIAAVFCAPVLAYAQATQEATGLGQPEIFVTPCAWNALHGRFIMKRINHQEAHSLNGDA